MIELTAPALREIWPKAPQAVIDAFLAKQDVLYAAGINHTRMRLSVAFAQVEHETNGFTIKDLTENINYSAAGAAKVWPSRFPGGADQVRAKYGTAPGWQVKLINDVYGGRMGNRPGTDDGSKFIGRGGPQVTGRDGYAEVGKRAGLPLEESPTIACKAEYQPEILAAFWTWKNLNPVVDVGGLKAATKPWNGGYIGMADREARMAGNDPAIARLHNVERVAPHTKTLPGSPPTAKPPQSAIDAATEKERKTRKGGTAIGVAGGGNEGVKATTDAPLMSTTMALIVVGVGIALIIGASFAIARKKAAVVNNWF